MKVTTDAYCIMLLVLSAILLVVAVFVLCAIVISNLSRKNPQPNHAVLHKRYSYRAEPHADQTTVRPNRLRDNEISDVGHSETPPPR